MTERKKQRIQDVSEGGVGAGYERYLIDRSTASPGRDFDALRQEMMSTQEAERQARNQLENAQRPVTREAKDRLRQRTQDEIFGDPETQRHYLEGVREALETLDGDRLHDFIMEHKSYGKSSYTSWNAELSALLGWQPEERFQRRDKAQTDRRISAATQHVLVDHYNTDVFQLTKKKINPWIFIDGKLGPYSVSVLGEYWTSRFGANSSKVPNPPGISDLDSRTYADDSAEAVTYSQALDYMRGQLTTSPVTPGSEQVEGDPAHRLSDKVRAKYARLDKAGDSIAINTLRLLPYRVDYTEPTNLSSALALAYGEDPKKAADSPRLFRALNLIAQQVGANIDTMRVNGGDTLEVTENGAFIVQKNDGTNRYEINLNTNDATS